MGREKTEKSENLGFFRNSRTEMNIKKSTSLSESAFRFVKTLAVIEDVSVFKIVAIHEKVACKSGIVKIAAHQL